jgi:hypothetical protein
MDDILPHRYSDSNTADTQQLVQDYTAGIPKIDLRVRQKQPPAAGGERKVASLSDEQWYGTQSLSVV